jgi:hypothetical protein
MRCFLTALHFPLCTQSEVPYDPVVRIHFEKTPFPDKVKRLRALI